MKKTAENSATLPVGIQHSPMVFRVWHIPSASMWKVSMFNDNHVYREPRNIELVDGTNYLAVDVPLNRADCVLMQQTEYSDRNGMPLFEGDILRMDQVLCKADRDAEIQAYQEEGREYVDPEYSSYEYLSRYRGALKLTALDDSIDSTNNGTYWYGWLHEEQDFVDEANLWLHRTLAGNLYEHPEIAAQTGCLPLHPDHIRDYDEHTND